ncbi:hypothetical protein Hden_0885 [Hyphomicrobium denitrificans ATCC 51888]|uniref:Uncharacterized protein n=1 Tax=Hyphomicrobium denitrificans (strain ATCC 51888 / DSM 1869 / NCIMB 11706 / TK 0415) TaxID=582899 RepID=D8JUB2_HYPDA|nr:hypothetical protein [Hyphomicrobium denitrificans]ADJ22702.1 hypothetical protein Hden_0885 [Hyphomicrobium denitrificans ATCC 51888]
MRSLVCMLMVCSGMAFAQPAIAAEPAVETICTNPKDDPPGPDTTVACYSDAGCALAETLGAEPIRDYDVGSAPFALARGKISAIIATSKDLIKTAQANGAKCQPANK